MKEFLELLRGNKTYVIAVMIGIVAILHYLGYIEEDAYQSIIGLLVGGAAGTFAAKVNRIQHDVASQGEISEAGDKKTQGMIMKKKLVLLVGMILLSANLVSAQAPPRATPTAKLGWDQDAVTLVEANSFTYRYYPDSVTTGVAFTGVICTGTVSPFQCAAPFPAFTPGNHTIMITAANEAGESAKSVPFAFSFVVNPAVPVNLRIISADAAGPD